MTQIVGQDLSVYTTSQIFELAFDNIKLGCTSFCYRNQKLWFWAKLNFRGWNYVTFNKCSFNSLFGLFYIDFVHKVWINWDSSICHLCGLQSLVHNINFQFYFYIFYWSVMHEKNSKSINLKWQDMDLKDRMREIYHLNPSTPLFLLVINK